jgi:glycosyltransferase involved in cell wall biosynthesis
MLSTPSESHAQVSPSDSCAPRLIVLAAAPSGKADGIHEYTRRLVATLRDRTDVEVSCENPRETPLNRPSVRGEIDDWNPRPTLLLQYNPFNFGRWGFAPWLPAKLWRLKRSNPRPKIALMVHEMYYPITDWRSALMGGWQRVQFFAVRVLSDVVFTSVSPWAKALESHRPRRPVHHLPVGSNLPDMRHARAARREQLGIKDDAIALAAFGTGHPSRLLDYVADAANEVASQGHETVLLNLGFNTPDVSVSPAVRVVTPGHLEEEAISGHLAAADIYLAPFTDGVSTRRTTVMAALQHGLSIVGTDGHNTDDMLRASTHGMRLTPVGDRAAFSRTVRELADDPDARAELARGARTLYEEEFDWSVVCDRLLAQLPSGKPGSQALENADLDHHLAGV